MTTLKNDFNAVHRKVLAELNSIAYNSGGDWDKVHRWDLIEATAREAGISAPPTWTPTPANIAGSVDAGTHLVRYRYLDERTGYVSNASDLYEFTAAGGNGREFAVGAAGSGAANINRSADPKVTHIVLEATTAGGQDFYEAARITNVTTAVMNYTDNDATLSESTFDWPDEGHDVPPYAQIIHPHKNIMFYAGHVVHTSGTVTVTNGNATVTGATTGWTAAAIGRYITVGTDNRSYKIAGYVSATEITLDETYAGASGGGKTYRLYHASPNTVFHSLPLFPEGVPPLYFTRVLQDKGDLVRGLATFGSDLVVMGEFMMELWTYTAIPAEDGQIVTIPGTRGVCWHRAAINVEGVLYGLDRQGIWQYGGQGAPAPISQRIDDILRANVDWTKAEKFHAVWLPWTRAIRWYYCNSTDTWPKRFIEWEPDSKRWGSGTHVMGVSASSNAISADYLRPIVGDENGWPWWADHGQTDGAKPTEIITGAVGAGATQTSIPITGGGLYTANNGLAGAGAYWVNGNEEVVISSNTATTLTLKAPGFSQAPTQGHTVQIGRINALLKTKAIALRDASETQQGRLFHLWFKPLASGKYLYVRFYFDHAAAAFSDWQGDTASYRGVVTPANGSTDVRIDLSNADGYARVEMPSTDHRFVEIELELKETNVALELYGLQVDGFAAELPDMS